MPEHALYRRGTPEHNRRRLAGRECGKTDVNDEISHIPCYYYLWYHIVYYTAFLLEGYLTCFPVARS